MPSSCGVIEAAGILDEALEEDGEENEETVSEISEQEDHHDPDPEDDPFAMKAEDED